jgi:hypothetical protein
MLLAEELRCWGDELRAITEAGLAWSADQPYHRERYEHVRRVAAQLFAAADLRPADEIERTVFKELTHVAPVPVVDAAIVDEDERLLLIRTAADLAARCRKAAVEGRWATTMRCFNGPSSRTEARWSTSAATATGVLIVDEARLPAHARRRDLRGHHHRRHARPALDR